MARGRIHFSDRAYLCHGDKMKKDGKFYIDPSKPWVREIPKIKETKKQRRKRRAMEKLHG